MRNNLKKLIFIALILLPRSLFAESVVDNNFGQNFENYTTKLEIISQSGKKINEYFVAVADTENERVSGLMNLKKMPKKNGMIFLFDKPELVQMWMKDTFIPLDMLFVRGDKIINIASNTKPLSKEIISSQNLVDKVIEINGSEAIKHNIQVGDKILISPKIFTKSKNNKQK